ncbi:ABC transporter ATP-binding protein [Stackebrandtia nassauensis]|uniref:ABC transporter related protein n=1 Tax=Stackebrandtia nassauensis (strain DSM 44728 / CIP 108903 / NRRL B-16338 / NBRC 102104 / LLR-40K-21) TaxID=446470 RepID=D3Q0W2_STANL|nr:ABC transporter ATP-binding protein [Stackebrandtia nassauensis]ADD43712.1 ABC transporter related protein [Stackebrandtia nassauensis DSM 44728]
MSSVPFHDPGEPNTASPLRYLLWLTARQPLRVFAVAALTSLSITGMILAPFFVAHAIDDGLVPRDWTPLLWWSAGVIGLGLVTAAAIVYQQRTLTFAKLDSMYRTVAVTTRQIARLGATLPKRVSTGEIVNVGGMDVAAIGEAMSVAGPGIGSIAALVVVGVLLFSISPILGAVVFVGTPLMVLAVGPLLERLQSRESDYRDHQGELTARSADIVAGLRVLRGVGGERAFADRYRARSAALLREGYKVGAVTSWVRSFETALPGLFLAAVVWIAARLAASGAISIGEMVAVYGYTAMLMLPMNWILGSVINAIRGLVAAKRVITVLRLRPNVSDGTETKPGPTAPSSLHDPGSGLTVPAGTMLVLAAADPAESRALADRLGRHEDSDVSFGDVRLSDMALSEVRERILVADNDAFLFAGTVRQIVRGGAEPDDAGVTSALRAAVAEDIVTALPEGIDTRMDTQARELSGGQRQRLRLARAIHADPEVLILVEPTSAVDAHTEATIAERLREARSGRTTIVVSSSPLLADRADSVAFLADGKIAATGNHQDLMDESPEYRALAGRSIGVRA